ncbi:hypothetical protein [Tengunoibacter tsumagoiensis]|uniref:Uncharacterized protein n=1 Tax=Tengunoibacter tsumagoiensis TaxID=2014871 RepID=A0A401ZZB4_9CHLR|nr:hypothetical protein [Tengunoibacter tsumagoiensis]GCE12200.1 hypothetical protein KTT_20590 [Tengunoibacter tsumagoiensis]
MMDAIIGRYRARVEESGLILRHSCGINFDLSPEETLGLLDFIMAYRQTLLSLREREPDASLERIVLEYEESLKSLQSSKG